MLSTFKSVNTTAYPLLRASESSLLLLFVIFLMLD